MSLLGTQRDWLNSFREIKDLDLVKARLTLSTALLAPPNQGILAKSTKRFEIRNSLSASAVQDWWRGTQTALDVQRKNTRTQVILAIATVFSVLDAYIAHGIFGSKVEDTYVSGFLRALEEWHESQPVKESLLDSKAITISANIDNAQISSEESPNPNKDGGGTSVNKSNQQPLDNIAPVEPNKRRRLNSESFLPGSLQPIFSKVMPLLLDNTFFNGLAKSQAVFAIKNGGPHEEWVYKYKMEGSSDWIICFKYRQYEAVRLSNEMVHVGAAHNAKHYSKLSPEAITKLPPILCEGMNKAEAGGFHVLVSNAQASDGLIITRVDKSTADRFDVFIGRQEPCEVCSYCSTSHL